MAALSFRSLLLALSIPLVVIFAYILQVEAPQVDWYGELLPMANKYMSGTPPTNKPVLKGLTVVVTGATSGIGKALAEFLVSQGATVIAMGRSKSKMDALLESSHSTGSTPGAIVPVMVDQSSLQSVKDAAQTIKAKFQSVDMIVCNAGMHYGKSILDAEYWSKPATSLGHDFSFTVNYLSHFLLTELLLPELSASTMTLAPTIVQISSSYHYAVDGRALDPAPNGSPLAAEPGGGAKLWRDSGAYANSKLAQILHARALKKHHTNLRIVSVCPTWAATQIGGNEGSMTHLLLAKLAYPLHDSENPQLPGWALASTLKAMFDTDSDSDWFINTVMPPQGRALVDYFSANPFMAEYGIRDWLTNMFAIALLTFQKFGAVASAAKSSKESYDKDLAARLYKWSKEEVKAFL